MTTCNTTPLHLDPYPDEAFSWNIDFFYLNVYLFP